MKRLLKFFSILLLFILITSFKTVLAKEIKIEDVITFMSDNNILKDNEYFYMFGKVLNGNNEYDIVDFSYSIHKKEASLDIIVNLIDKKIGNIEKNMSLFLKDNLIGYINENAIDSLESRIVTIIFNQLIYSVGGARGYNEDDIVNWMNQIDLNKITKEKGIDLAYEPVIYSVNENNKTYEYEVKVPKSFIIDINKLTNEIPTDFTINVYDIKSDYSSISMKILAENYINEMCTVYRKNNESEYVMVGNVSCNNGVFVDTNLEEGTTYSYQVTIKDKVMCANDVEVTTDPVPDTGVFINLSVIFVLVILGVIIYIFYRKKNLFNKV